MRKIKFTAYDIKNNKIKSVSYVSSPGINGYFITCDDGTELDGNNEGILLQYTGLKDKNGTDIFEGDILRMDNGFEEDLCNMVVNIKNGIVGTRNILDFGELDDDIFVLGNIDNNGRILDTNLEDFKVIGNIYENNNLLTNQL